MLPPWGQAPRMTGPGNRPYSPFPSWHMPQFATTFTEMVMEKGLLPDPLPLPNHFPGSHISVPRTVPGTQEGLNKYPLNG